jgi:general secretion pathway protein K
MAALATLASIYSVYVGNVAVSSHIDDDRLRARAAVLSGIELTAMKLGASPPEARPGSGAFHFRIDRSSVRVTYVDEGARIDLNAAPKELLAGLFVALGAETDLAADFADHILAWRKGGAAAGENAEAAAYESANLGYAPRRAPFQDVLEIRLVRGLPRTLVDRALPFLTIYSGRALIDVRTADPVVLSALPHAAPEAVEKVVAQQAIDPNDGEAMLKILGTARTGASATGTKTTRVDVEVRLDDGALDRAEVVLLSTDADEQPYEVLTWRDASDGPL